MKKTKVKIRGFDACFQTSQMMIAENYGAQREPHCPTSLAEKLQNFKDVSEESKVA